jgi:chromate transporter
VVFALARITPGTNLLAFCAGISWQLLGWPGAVAAVLAMTVPAAIVVVLLTHSYQLLTSNGVAMAALGGVLAAAVGMMPAAAWQLARPYLQSARWPHALAIVGGAIALSAGLSVSPVQVLGLAALTGVLWRIPE